MNESSTLYLIFWNSRNAIVKKGLCCIFKNYEKAKKELERLNNQKKREETFYKIEAWKIYDEDELK